MDARRWTCVLLATMLVGCRTWSVHHIPSQPDDDQMRAELLHRVPPGTPVAEARRVLVAGGFDCGDEEQPGETAFFCSRTESYKSMWVQRRWMVSVHHEDDAVTDIVVTSGLTGL